MLTLLTDFGLRDHYVGVMKGVILARAPHVRIVDLCHEVAPHDIHGAALLLAASYRSFPLSTVHVVVVDPGVGSARRPRAVEAPAGRFVGPDKGVFGYVLDEQPAARCVELRERRFWLPEVSQTFHGRDVFAPVAAALAVGLPLDALGPPVADPLRLASPAVEVLPDGGRRGVAIYVDRFGNLVTNIRPADLAPGPLLVEVGGQTISGLSPHYAVAAPLIALVGSLGRLEIAVPQGSAATTLGIGVGAPVAVRRKEG
ncbi:MAG: SAM-dependent chlorinase/fluorinase [Chloroflexi bacterium]|nr:SAM-dependent chlorinase/fluorinase [Chloroflexota bacterium]